MIGWMLIVCGVAILIAAGIFWSLERIRARDEITLQDRRRLLGGGTKD